MQSITPQELLIQEHPGAIQVRERGGTVYVLEAPRMVGDSMMGFVKGVPRALSIVTVDRVAVRKIHTLKTAGIAAAGAAVGFGMVMLVLWIAVGAGG